LETGCASSNVVVQYDGPTLKVEAAAVGVLELQVIGARPWQHYEKLRDMLAAVEKRERLDAIAPWEYAAAKQPSSAEDYWRHTTLGPAAERMGIPRERVIVLHAQIEERTSRSATDMETPNVRIRQGRGFNSTIIARVQALHPATGRPLGSIERFVVEDRFSDVPDYDPRPLIKPLLTSAVDQLIDGLVDAEVLVEAAPEAPDPPDDMSENPSRVLIHAVDGATLQAHLDKVEPIMREAALYTRFRYFEPDMSLQRFQHLLKQPRGVFLGSKLVTEVGGQPAQHTFQWRRAVRRSTQ